MYIQQGGAMLIGLVLMLHLQTSSNLVQMGHFVRLVAKPKLVRCCDPLFVRLHMHFQAGKQ